MVDDLAIGLGDVEERMAGWEEGKGVEGPMRFLNVPFAAPRTVISNKLGKIYPEPQQKL